MARRNQPIKCEIWIPNGDGTYRNWRDLTEEEKEAVRWKNTERLAAAFGGLPK